MPAEQDLEAHLQLRTDERELTGILRIGPNVPVDSISAEILRIYVESCGVAAHNIDPHAIQRLYEIVRENPGSEHEADIAKGKPPRDAERPTLTWNERIAEQIQEITARKQSLQGHTPAHPDHDKDHDPDQPGPAEPVDHYNHSPFVVVRESEVIATLSPPDPGEDGENIFGACIPAKQSPAAAEFDNETVQLTSDYRAIALVAGRLVYTGPSRTIETTLHITGDVDFTTGNIDFPGPVLVEGGVKDLFRIESKGTTTVRKLVEAASISSQRDIVLERGVAGRESATLQAARDIEAGYIESATAHARNDCVIKRELTNARTEVLGCIRCPTGAIRGGIAIAARGIEVAIAGSAREVRTELLVGSIPELDNKLAALRELDARIAAEQRDARCKLEALTAGQAASNPTLIERSMALRFQIEQAETHRSKLRTARERIESNLRAGTTARLTVTMRAHAGVVVWMRGHAVAFKDETKGPFVLRVDAAGNPVIERNGQPPQPVDTVARVTPDERVPSLPTATDAATDAA